MCDCKVIELNGKLVDKLYMSKIIFCFTIIIQLLDETEQNIVIYQWRADQLFANAEGRGK